MASLGAWTVAFAVSIASILFLMAGPAVAGPGTGAISGNVFLDRNQDGIRQGVEPGLAAWSIAVSQGGTQVGTATNDASGNYTVGGLQPDTYTVTAEPLYIVLCADPVPGFNPLVIAGCLDETVPWQLTTADSVDVSVPAAGSATVDFGARYADAMGFHAKAILENDFAPPGMPIEAQVSGQDCAANGVPPTKQGVAYDYDLTFFVLGAGEQPGCARPGDEITFLVGGVAALETVTYTPMREGAPPFVGLPLVAMQEHAWYWYEAPEGTAPPEGARVQAVIGGQVCGEAVLERAAGAPPVAGFSRLIVPSADLQPGCGRPGATVFFLVEGVEAETAVAWEPGVRRIESLAPVGPTPSPTPLPATDLPETGARRPGGQASVVWVTAALAVSLGGLLLWRTTRRRGLGGR